MPSIQRLPPSVVNKIAAGEVIERPASVVKELLENSLDAGATRVDVVIEQGGIELIRVADNGSGIAGDELPLAVASHATSKLRSADDLFCVGTLGFRGEALASIAEVSHFTIRSRAADSEPAAGGAELVVQGGQLQPIAPCGSPVGTTIEVRQLFFNTPVRRKFLRSTQTEIGHVCEAFTRLALAHPQVHLTLRHNQRTLYDLAPTTDHRQRIGAFFGPAVADALIWVESVDGQVRLSGYAAHPSQNRADPRGQYLFLNGRFIRDRSLQHALGEAYRGLLLTGRYPVAFLYCAMPPELVDVNVHPTKLEVRFQDGGQLYRQLLSTLRTEFLRSDLTHRGHARGGDNTPAIDPADASRRSSSGGPGGAASEDDSPRLFATTDRAGQWDRAQLDRWAGAAVLASEPRDALGSSPAAAHGSAGRGATPAPSGSRGEAGPAAAATSSSWGGAGSRPPLALNKLAQAWEHRTDAPAAGATVPSELASDAASADEAAERAAVAASAVEPGSTVAPTQTGELDRAVSWEAEAAAGAGAEMPSRTPALQIHNRYIVTESAEGVLVIDQHALHERILYEQLRTKLEHDGVETQTMLVPEPVDLTAAEAALVLEHREVLAQLGLRIDPFGGGTLLVCGYPVLLGRSSPREILQAVVDLLTSQQRTPERRDLTDALLHQMACKAAVKAGDRLTSEEIDALLEQRHWARDQHHCPHGRPTALIFTREELDKQFKRT